MIAKKGLGLKENINNINRIICCRKILSDILKLCCTFI